MRLIRARTVLAGALVAIAGTAAGTVLAAAPASAGASQVVLVDCTGHGQVRPTGYDIGCMPPSELVTGLRWTSWRSVAFGSGVLKVTTARRPARRASTSATRS